SFSSPISYLTQGGAAVPPPTQPQHSLSVACYSLARPGLSPAGTRQLSWHTRPPILPHSLYLRSHQNPPTCSLTPQKNYMPPLCARNGRRRIQPDTTLFDTMHWKIRRHFSPNDTYRRIVLIRDGAIHNELDVHVFSIFSYKNRPNGRRY